MFISGTSIKHCAGNSSVLIYTLRLRECANGNRTLSELHGLQRSSSFPTVHPLTPSHNMPKYGVKPTHHYDNTSHNMPKYGVCCWPLTGVFMLSSVLWLLFIFAQSEVKLTYCFIFIHSGAITWSHSPKCSVCVVYLCVLTPLNWIKM